MSAEVGPLYVEAVHPGAYRPNGQTRALVVGAVWATPVEREGRACFCLVYPDGSADHIPVSEVNGTAYRFVQEMSE